MTVVANELHPAKFLALQQQMGLNRYHPMSPMTCAR